MKKAPIEISNESVKKVKHGEKSNDSNEREVKFSKGDLEDIQAIGSILNGRKEEYSKIYNKYKGILLYKIMFMLRCDKQVAEDLMMDIFEKVYKNLHRYQPNFTFNAWLSKISKNYLIDYIRKMKMERYNQSIDKAFSTDDEGGEVTIQVHDKVMNPEQILISKDGIGMIQLIVDKMKEDYRILFNLRYIEQMSYDDISKESGMSIAKVKIDLFRVRQILIDEVQKLNLLEGFSGEQLTVGGCGAIKALRKKSKSMNAVEVF